MYLITGRDGQEYGPVDVKEMSQWAREGRIDPDAPVEESATGRRYVAREMPHLAGILLEPELSSRPRDAFLEPSPRVVSSGVSPRQPRSKVVAGLLGMLLGAFGAHRFYLGYTRVGVTMVVLGACTCFSVTAVWGLVEGVMCLFGSMRDSDGRPLTDG